MVVEQTLNKLYDYIKKGYDAAYPIPIAMTRKQVLDLYAGERSMGWRDTGCMAIDKDAFYRIGKWNEKYHMQGESEMYRRMGEHKLAEIDQTDTLITHMCAINNYSKDEEEYQKQMKEDNERLTQWCKNGQTNTTPLIRWRD